MELTCTKLFTEFEIERWKVPANGVSLIDHWEESGVELKKGSQTINWTERMQLSQRGGSQSLGRVPFGELRYSTTNPLYFSMREHRDMWLDKFESYETKLDRKLATSAGKWKQREEGETGQGRLNLVTQRTAGQERVFSRPLPLPLQMKRTGSRTLPSPVSRPPPSFSGWRQRNR